MSHQVALVIEKQEGNKVTGTMMMMGRDVPLKGELVDRTHHLRRREEPKARSRAGRPSATEPGPPQCQADRRHAAGRRDADRRDDDQQRSGEVDRREAEDAKKKRLVTCVPHATSRRTVLKGMGATIALPFLDA